MKNKDSVAILMSTYNGEQFLDEQIKSIINQTYQDWHLYIRDDGSSDNTVEILRKYSKKDNRITFINENKIKNVGIVASFMSLLDSVNAYYYMFSDQDDVWKMDKIAITLEKMKSETNKDNIPVCVHTDLQVVDSKLKGEQSMKKGYVWSSFYHLMFGNCVTGCTMMINQSVKDKIKFESQNKNLIPLHDWWIALIASAFGKVVFINEKTIYYRQHEKNVIGSNKKNDVFHIIGRLCDQKTDENNMINVIRMAYEFDRLYKTNKSISLKKRELIHSYAKVFEKSSPFFNLKTVIYNPPRRMKIKGNFFFAYLMIKDFKKIRN